MFFFNPTVFCCLGIPSRERGDSIYCWGKSVIELSLRKYTHN